jgi:hypothetical protein
MGSPSLHPRIAEVTTELRNAQAEMQELLAPLSADAMARTAPEGGWTVAQVIEHVLMTEDGIGRLIGGMLKQLEGTVDTDTDAIGPTLAHFEIHIPTRKLKAPDMVTPKGALPISEVLATQADVRQRLIAALEHGSGRALHTMTSPHPFLGPLSGYQWALLIALHQRRHLTQIRNILEVAS